MATQILPHSPASSPSQLRTSIYARVSTNNGQDPTVQTRELEEYCQRWGWKVAGQYIDIGISGAKEKRGSERRGFPAVRHRGHARNLLFHQFQDYRCHGLHTSLDCYPGEGCCCIIPDKPRGVSNLRFTAEIARVNRIKDLPVFMQQRHDERLNLGSIRENGGGWSADAESDESTFATDRCR